MNMVKCGCKRGCKRTCTCWNNNNKMKEYLQDDDKVAYGNQYFKSKLLEHYGKAIFIAEGDGLSEIVTFREKTSETCTHPTNLRTFAREGMSYYPGRMRCRLGRSESSRRNVSIQIDNSHRRRH